MRLRSMTTPSIRVVLYIHHVTLASQWTTYVEHFVEESERKLCVSVVLAKHSCTRTEQKQLN